MLFQDSPLLVQSIEATKTILRRVTSLENLRVMGITNEQYDRELGRITGTSENYPYATVMPGDIDDEDSSYNKFALSTIGVKTKVLGDYCYKVQLVPIKMTLDINYFTQDTKDLLKFIQHWKYNYRKATFILTAGDFEVSIRTELSGAIRFPDKDLDTGSCYKLQSQVIIHTYVGEIYKQRLMTDAKVNVYSDVNNLIDKLAEDAKANTPSSINGSNNFILVDEFQIKGEPTWDKGQ